MTTSLFSPHLNNIAHLSFPLLLFFAKCPLLSPLSFYSSHTVFLTEGFFYVHANVVGRRRRRRRDRNLGPTNTSRSKETVLLLLLSRAKKTLFLFPPSLPHSSRTATDLTAGGEKRRATGDLGGGEEEEERRGAWPSPQHGQTA